MTERRIRSGFSSITIRFDEDYLGQEDWASKFWVGDGSTPMKMKSKIMENKVEKSKMV